jgi:hypothetical protein
MTERTVDEGRRRFLKTGAAVAAGATCLGMGLREALAQAKKAGKPLLTEANINDHIRRWTKDDIGRHCGHAKRNLEEYLDRHFHVTEAEKETIASMTKRDRDELNKGLEHAAKHGIKPQVKIVHKDGQTSIDVDRTTTLVSLNASDALPQWVITTVKVVVAVGQALINVFKSPKM